MLREREEEGRGEGCGARTRARGRGRRVRGRAAENRRREAAAEPSAGSIRGRSIGYRDAIHPCSQPCTVRRSPYSLPRRRRPLQRPHLYHAAIRTRFPTDSADEAKKEPEESGRRRSGLPTPPFAPASPPTAPTRPRRSRRNSGGGGGGAGCQRPH
ncbi:unnamed protein product [Urochloa humidicola]